MDLERLLLYVLLVGVVFVVNLLPAFGPPTWLVLVLFRLHQHLSVVGLVLLGAMAAASGRLLLALATRRLRKHVSEKTRDNLEGARQVVQGKKGRAGAGLALFALSPVPSAQLFEAAGLVGVPLVPLTLAFFSGRLVSYSAYTVGAKAAEDTSVGELMTKSLTSPWGIAIEVALLGGVYALTRVDWKRFVH